MREFADETAVADSFDGRRFGQLKMGLVGSSAFGGWSEIGARGSGTSGFDGTRTVSLVRSGGRLPDWTDGASGFYVAGHLTAARSLCAIRLAGISRRRRLAGCEIIAAAGFGERVDWRLNVSAETDSTRAVVYMGYNIETR